ncbi:MAG: sensor histidine kinase [Clostridiales bacterium]|nr:sensor histidine kinase [Clostridiales bacterium]
MRRVAHDLHDGPVQTLTAALLELRRGSRRLADDPACEEFMTHSIGLIQAALDEIRGIIAYHRPAALDEPVVGDMLRVFLDDVRTQHPEPRIECVFEGDENGRYLTDSVRIALFRIVQEAVTNALVHAHASTIRVVVSFSDDGILCSVEDDGCGIPDIDGPTEVPRGHGLVSMRDRAELLDAEFAMRSTPNEGTIVSVRFPA